MSKIEVEFKDSLKRINFSFRNKKIETECIKDHDGFTILGRNFGPFEKGKKYYMKFFTTIPFIEENILKISHGEKCDNVDVQRQAIAERDDPRLIHQDMALYLNKIKEFKHFLDNEIKKGIKPSVDLDRYNSYLINILDNRLLKLLKLTKTQISVDNEHRLTTSETELFKKMYKLVNTWKKFYTL